MRDIKDEIRYSSKKGRQGLAAEKARKILECLANLPDWPLKGERGDFEKCSSAVERMRSLYPELFGQESVLAVIALRNLIRKAWCSDAHSAEWILFQVRFLHEKLRRLRAICDPVELAEVFNREVREYRYAFSVLKEVGDPVGRPVAARAALVALTNVFEWRRAEREEAPPMQGWEYLMTYLQRSVRDKLARRCKSDECPAPYFFRIKPGQEYCSQDCVAWGKRMKAKRWWNAHGPGWRHNRGLGARKRR